MDLPDGDQVMRLALVALVACSSAAKPPAPPSGPTTAKLGGVDIAYETRGQGPLCVAIPGGPGFDAGYLRDPELEKIFTVVYVNLAGTRGSGKLPAAEQYSLARDAETIEALRVHLKQDKLCVLGHSYGGFVAQKFALDHPAHIGRLILYSTTPASTPDWVKNVVDNLQWFKDRPWFADAMRGFFELDDKAQTQAELDEVLRMVRPTYFADWDHHVAAYAERFERSHFELEVYKRRVKADYDVRPQLASLAVPTLVITGKQDFSGGVVPSTWIAERIPNAKLVVIDNAGHFAHVEQPAEFFAALREFMR